MKRNLKWKERLGALLLAVLFVMQAILSFLPMDMVQAAAKRDRNMADRSDGGLWIPF